VEPAGHGGEALMELIARTMFTRDAAGRFVEVQKPGGPRAPRFYVLWNGRSARWWVRHDLPSALVARLAAIVAEHPVPRDLERLPSFAAAIRAALAEHAPVADELGGDYEYVFPDALYAPGAPAHVVAATANRAADSPGAPAHVVAATANRAAAPPDAPPEVIAVTADSAAVLQRWLPEWSSYTASGLPMMAMLVDGAAVAVAACVRFPSDATEAGIETHPAFRGRGYAAAVTAAWARAVRARGLVPLYGTSWKNLASQRVAAKLGLIRVAASFAIA
jgi:RimJ/RimL family protein N-acetyltransferase